MKILLATSKKATDGSMKSLESHPELAGTLIHSAILRLMQPCSMILVLMHSSSVELTQMTLLVCSSQRMKAHISCGDRSQITLVSKKKFSQELFLTALLDTVYKNASNMMTNMKLGLEHMKLGFKMTQLSWDMT